MRGSSPSRPSTRPRSRSRASSSTRAAGAAPSLRPSCSRCSPTTSAATRGRRGRPRKPMRFDRRLITHFEWLLPLLALGVSGLGAMTVYSATHVPGMHGLSPVVPMLLTGVPAAAILAQPDLGTVAVLGIVSLTMLMLGGIRLRWFVLLGVAVAVAAPVAWPHLKVYQQKRILTFVHPEMDPRGAGYHVLQSKIAVGSGMTWGKGFLRGTQNQLNFLPEQHTDFIFSVFAEEWGFVGALVLLALYLALVLRGIVIASRARDRFGVLLVLGLTAIVFWQAVINVGMTTGLLPVVGIPLPFFSYGGSSLLCLLIGVGLSMNVSMRRYFF